MKKNYYLKLGLASIFLLSTTTFAQLPTIPTAAPTYTPQSSSLTAITPTPSRSIPTPQPTPKFPAYTPPLPKSSPQPPPAPTTKGGKGTLPSQQTSKALPQKINNGKPQITTSKLPQKLTIDKGNASIIQTKSQPQPNLTAIKDLAAVKLTLETSLDYLSIIAAGTKAVALLTTKITPQEKTMLKKLLAQRISQFYNERANKSMQEITALSNLFQAVAQNKESAPLVSKNQLATTNALAKIVAAKTQIKPTPKMTALNAAIPTMVSNIDRYEKQLFIDGVTTIFNTRKTLTKEELISAQKMFMELASPASRKQKTFDVITYQQFENWGHIIQSTLTLTAPQPQPTFKDLVILYQSTLPYIRLPEAAYERELFISNTMPALFTHRGNVKLDEIQALSVFFDTTIKTPNLLAANQLPSVMLWAQELTTAQSIATQKKTYLEALIDQALATKNLTSYSSALALFTQHTNANARKAFIIALNTLFVQRDTPPKINKQQLSNLLEEVGRKKLTASALFLSPNQKVKLNEWIATLGAEIKAGK